MKLTILNTEDGSSTILSEQYNATYHSTHGAIQETQKVFIEAGFHYAQQNVSGEIRILEIGFGTGLNVFMTYLEALKGTQDVSVYSLELHPIGEEMAKKLNYPQLLNAPEAELTFLQCHKIVNSEIFLPLNTQNHFKFYLKINSFEVENYRSDFHLIYFDAFSPSVQPTLWEVSFLQKMYNALLPGGVLVTYCAKGAFKRALKSVGFVIESLPGPKGKREMTRAIKI